MQKKLLLVRVREIFGRLAGNLFWAPPVFLNVRCSDVDEHVAIFGFDRVDGELRFRIVL
jgi:hypothetical protein